MSALWPHPPYAEDQPHHHTILTTHVLFRGFQAGSILGSLSGALYYTYLSLRKPPPSSSSSSTIPSSKPSPLATTVSPSATISRGASASAISTRALFMPTVLRTAATGSILCTALMVVMLPLRMRGREEIEWKDRSWRLLENKGQVEVDSFSLSGAVLGAAAAWRATGGSGRLGMGQGGVGVGVKAEGLKGFGANLRGWLRGRGGMVLGGAGVGASLGVLVYFGWRYGVNGGKWAEAVEEGVESGAKGVGVV